MMYLRNIQAKNYPLKSSRITRTPFSVYSLEKNFGNCISIFQRKVKDMPGPWIGAMEATIFTGWVYNIIT